VGYAFTLQKPHDGVAVDCAFDSDQMTYVRLIMLESGAITGDGLEAALSRAGLEVSAETLPTSTFTSNSGQHVTADQAGFIAARLRRAVEAGIIGDLLGFYDDSPGTAAVRAWVEEFAEFNERAAQLDGYYVC
jgi:hypothetical protein